MSKAAPNPKSGPKPAKPVPAPKEVEIEPVADASQAVASEIDILKTIAAPPPEPPPAPPKHGYVLRPGAKMVLNGRRVQPGEVVTLTDAQVRSWGDLIQPV